MRNLWAGNHSEDVRGRVVERPKTCSSLAHHVWLEAGRPLGAQLRSVSFMAQSSPLILIRGSGSPPFNRRIPKPVEV